MKDTFKSVLTNIGAAGCAGLVVFLYLTLSDIRDKNVGVSVESPPAREVRGEPTATVIPPKGIQVHQPKAKKKLGLPKEVQENKDVSVATATQVPRSERPQTVTTTVDTQTGQFQTYVRPDPYPWFAWDPRGEARLSYGYKTGEYHNPKPVVRLGVTYDVIRVKALTAGVTSTFDSDGQAFVGVGVAYRW